MNFKHLTTCMEAIDFQSSTFFQEIAALVSPYIGTQITNADFDKFAGKLEPLIKHHTNVTTEIFSDGRSRNMGISTPMISNHHPFVKPYFDVTSSADGLRLVNKAKELLKGSVDLKRSRVTGIFAEVVPKMYIGLDEFSGYQDAEEFAAGILHELGHYFSYLEAMDKSVTTNMVLLGLDIGLRSNKTIKEREVLLRAAASELDITDRVRGIDPSGNDKAIVALYLTEVAHELRSQSGSFLYDTNSWEQAADQFAARHGAGRHLATALDKGHRLNDDNALRTRSQYYMFEVLKVLIGLSGIAAGGFTVAVSKGALIGPAFSLIIASLGNIFTDQYSSHQPQYDTPKDRFARLRRQLIEKSKSGKLRKDEVESIAADVAIIDRLILDYNDFSGWFTVFKRYVLSSARSKHDAVVLQKELESIALNDLFLKSAELRVA